MKKTVKKWTAAEEHKLRLLCGTMPIQDIADKMDRSLISCKQKALRLGVSYACAETKRRKVQDRDAEMCRVLHDAGFSRGVIKEFVDSVSKISESAIGNILAYRTYVD